MLWGWLKERAAIKLSERLDTLEDSMRALSQADKARELDFTELYEKVQRLYGRIARRASRMGESTQGDAGGTEPTSLGSAERLGAPGVSPAHQQALREISIRRGLG